MKADRLLAAALLIGAALASAVQATPAPGIDGPLAGILNAARQKAGRAPLALNAALTKAAIAQSEAMGSQHYYGHVSRRGTTPQARLKAVRYPKGAIWGEAIAGGFDTPEQAMGALLADPHNLPTLLYGGYTQVGVGYSVVKGACLKSYLTVTLGNPQPPAGTSPTGRLP